ncbi:MAG: acyl carrier protein [Cyanobacteria bacterium P01_F01_bin.4]
MTSLTQNHAPSPISQGQIQTWLIAKLAEQLGVVPSAVDIQEDFMNHGLNSIEAINFSGELEQFLSRRLSPTLLWDYSNIESLAEYLATVAQADSAKESLANIDQMPESEMDALLGSMLTQETA